MEVVEPVRPVADSRILNVLDTMSLDRFNVHENRERVCRVGLRSRRLVLLAPAL